MGEIAKILSKKENFKYACAHLDPDLNRDSLERMDGWKPSLGQVDAAQSHLVKQGVSVGDLFLFFGWFRPFEFIDKKPVWVKKEKDFHCFFGYLQIGEILELGSNPNKEEILKKYPYLFDQPHLMGERSENNTLYIARDKLLLNGIETSLPGASSFDKYNDQLKLTAPNCSKSIWRVPDWLSPEAGISSLSYHTDKERWFKNDEGEQCLKSVAKGQEFVFDTKNKLDALNWIENLINSGLGNNLNHVKKIKKKI